MLALEPLASPYIAMMVILGVPIFITLFAGLVGWGRPLRAAGYLLLLAATAYLYARGLIDTASLVFSLLTLAVGLAASMYTDAYESAKYGRRDLHPLIDLFALSVYATFVAPNLLTFIVCWLIAEIVGFFAIVYEVEERTLRAGLRYLVVSMIPSDLALLTLLAYVSIALGSFSRAMMTSMAAVGAAGAPMPSALSVIVLLGLLAKAAVAPLHFWLPDAHSLAPAPASAILSGVMVKMGIYGVLRALPLVEAPYTVYAFIVFASITSVYAGLVAIVQNDIKRILAYSTIENTGLIALTLMLYRLTWAPIFYYAMMALTISHAFFKAALFMNSGSVEVCAHTRKVSELGYLARVEPSMALSALLSALALMGVPPTMGFVAKLLLISALVDYISMNVMGGVALLCAAAIALALTVIYTMKYISIYWGSWRATNVQAPGEAKKLVRWEYVPGALNVVAAPVVPWTLFPLGFSPELAVTVTLSLLIFMFVLSYLRVRMRAAAREDPHWLGGFVP